MSENFEGFVYLDLDDPMVAWNVVRSNFYTPSCLPQSERTGVFSFNMANLLRHENAARATAEFQLEAVRQAHFSQSVSRLTGLFVFDDKEIAKRVADKGNWSGHFSPACLTEVGVSANRSTRVDSGWIAKMRSQENVLVEGWEKIAERYWSGEPESDQPCWERIIEGWVTIWGIGLKNKAFEEIRKYWPQSLFLLEVAANSASIGSCDGAIMPHATYNGELLEINYYLRMVDAMCPEFCERLGLFIRTGSNNVCRLGGDSESVTTPDFSCYGFKRRIDGFLRGW